jgi:MFS transporter, DHA1 family, multidrug resistance protein
MHLHAAPRTSRRIGMLSLLGALSAFGPLSMDMYLPATPTIAASLHASQTLVQLTMSGCLAGLALGQLVAGPLSDRLGRKNPLLAGLAAFVVLSVACVMARDIETLIAFRFLQGMAGAAGVVLSLAMVRDMYEGSNLARVLGSLTLVFGLAPVLAPVVGAQILRFTSWRGVFAVLAAVGLALLIASCFLPETLPRGRRTAARFRQLLADSRTLLQDRRYAGNALAVGFGTGALITYVSSLPFIVEDGYRQSPQLFSLFFTVNAIGLTAMAQLGSRLVRRVSAWRLTRAALSVLVLGGAGFCAAALMKHPPLAALLVPLFVFVAAFGMMRPNATALALAGQSSIAGTASAYLGAFQFTLGAVLAPLAGLAGLGSTGPAGIIIGGLCVAAFASQTLIVRRRKPRAPGRLPLPDWGREPDAWIPALSQPGSDDGRDQPSAAQPMPWTGYDPGAPPIPWVSSQSPWASPAPRAGSPFPWFTAAPEGEPDPAGLPGRGDSPIGSWRPAAPGEPPVPRRF